MTNPVVSSSNGRFKAVVRRFDIPDFQSRPASSMPFDPEAPSPTHTTVALYGEWLIAEIAIPASDVETVFIPDSGEFIVALNDLDHACGWSPSPG